MYKRLSSADKINSFVNISLHDLYNALKQYKLNVKKRRLVFAEQTKSAVFIKMLVVRFLFTMIFHDYTAAIMIVYCFAVFWFLKKTDFLNHLLCVICYMKQYIITFSSARHVLSCFCLLNYPLGIVLNSRAGYYDVRFRSRARF